MIFPILIDFRIRKVTMTYLDIRELEDDHVCNDNCHFRCECGRTDFCLDFDGNETFLIMFEGTKLTVCRTCFLEEQNRPGVNGL